MALIVILKIALNGILPAFEKSKIKFKAKAFCPSEVCLFLVPTTEHLAGVCQAHGVKY